MCNDTVASQGLCNVFCGFLYDDGYTQGSEDGYSKGFDVGFLKGSEEGYSKGFDVGFLKGSEEGYSKGFDVGFAKGSDDGFAKGSHDGFAKGSHDGFAKGFEVGYKSGHDKGYYKGLYDADYPISYLINNQVLVIENVLFCLLLIYFYLNRQRQPKWDRRHEPKGYGSV